MALNILFTSHKTITISNNIPGQRGAENHVLPKNIPMYDTLSSQRRYGTGLLMFLRIRPYCTLSQTWLHFRLSHWSIFIRAAYVITEWVWNIVQRGKLMRTTVVGWIEYWARKPMDWFYSWRCYILKFLFFFNLTQKQISRG